MRADRLLKLMILLQSRGKMRAQDLAHELEVSRRTILRDVDALSFSGIPIYSEGGHGGGIALDENYRIQLNGLKEQEVQALITSSNASLLADIGLEDAAEQSLLKLLTALPSLHEESAKRFQNRIYIDPLAWWHEAQPLTHMNKIQDAVHTNTVIEVVYRKHDGTRLTRIVEPYGLIAKASVWYLVAKHEDKFRNYRISRIYEVRLFAEKFVRDDDFILSDYWRKSTQSFLESITFFSFTLAIHPDKRDFVLWYSPSFYELIETDKNGWYVAKFYVETLELATAFVVGLGGQVKLIEPDVLRQAVSEKIQDIIENHGE